MSLTQGRRKLSVGFISAMAVVMAAGVLVFVPAAGAQDRPAPRPPRTVHQLRSTIRTRSATP